MKISKAAFPPDCSINFSAFNLQEAFSSNLDRPPIGSSNWGMYDYNIGNAGNIAAFRSWNTKC